jgi:hypothetical protein
MAITSLKTTRNNFDKNLSSALLLFEVAKRFSGETEDREGTAPAVRPGQSRQIAGLAFLIMVRSWEDLVEGCLVRYVAGAKAPSGYAPYRYCSAASLAEAYGVAIQNGLRGNADGENSHLFVSSWKAVCKCSDMLFKAGKPFSNLTTEQRRALENATTIRNRVAHSSAKTRAAFNRLARLHREPGVAGPLPRGYTVGQLLMTSGSHFFGERAETQECFRHYHRLFLSLADIICPTQTLSGVRAKNP